MRISTHTVTASALLITVASILPSTSVAQSAFYNDASCTVLCDGSNCGGAKFVQNPTPANLQVGDCYKARADRTGSAKSVTFLLHYIQPETDMQMMNNYFAIPRHT